MFQVFPSPCPTPNPDLIPDGGYYAGCSLIKPFTVIRAMLVLWV